MSRRILVVLCSALTAIGLMAVPGAASADVNPASLTWQRPQLTDPNRGLVSVSCVAKDLCRAGGTPNLIKRWDGTSWKDGDGFPADTRGIRAITCTSRTFCAAVQVVYRRSSQDYAYRPIIRRTDGTWDLSASLVAVGAANPLFPPGSVSCSGASFCMLVNRYQQFQRWNGTSWTSPAVFSDQAVGTYVSCTSRTFCRAVNTHNETYTWNGSAWSDPRSLDFQVNSLVGLDCVDSAFCMALTNTGYVVIKGSTQTQRKSFDNNSFLSGLSCTDRTFCLAVDKRGNSYKWDGTSWTGPHQVPSESYIAVSCSSPNFCVAISAQGDAVHRVDGAWQAPRRVIMPGGGIEDVACDSPELCVLVDSHGEAAAYTGSSWTTPRQVSPWSSRLDHVTCAGGSFCAAADSHGNVLFRRHGHWSDPQPATVHPDAGVVLLSCGSATLCAVLTGREAFRVWNGSTWRTVGTFLIASEGGVNLSCVADGCVLSTSSGDHPDGNQTAVWRAGTNLLERVSNTAATPLSCASLTFCMGLGGFDGNQAMRFDGTSWQPAPMASGAIPGGDISCGSTTLCVAVGGRRESTWNGTHWSAPNPDILATDAPLDQDLSAVSCRRTICAAVTPGGWTVVAT